jgi:hypothetical protein
MQVFENKITRKILGSGELKQVGVELRESARGLHFSQDSGCISAGSFNSPLPS